MSFLPDSDCVLESGSLMMTSMVFSATIEHRPFGNFIRKCVGRHLSGDWGDCCPEDASLNDVSLIEGYRVFSVYDIPRGLFTLHDKVWIITEADRSYTTILFPSEY